MKNLFFLALSVCFLFTACEEDSVNPNTVDITGVYVLNYGNYGGTEGSLSSYNPDTKTITNNVYKASNSDVSMQGNPQFVYEYKGNVYIMGNGKDEVYSIDKTTLVQASNGVTKDIVKPRYCAGYGDYLYISCWGGNVWTDQTLSYIAKYNINTNTVDEKIALHGGPEALEIVDGKLYCALNYQNKIAIMDLANNEFTYIEDLPAVCSYFLKDTKDNLYVTLVGSYSVATTKTGIGYVNTTTNTLDEVYELADVSQGYSSILSANNDFSKVYVIASAYDANYNISGGVQILNTEDQTFETTPLVSNVNGINAVSVNPETNEVYVMISESAATTGQLHIYNEDGDKTDSFNTGIAPAWALFME